MLNIEIHKDQLVTGFLALSTPDEGESNPLLIGEAAINEIRIGRRDATSNSIAFNGGYGVTVASLEAPQRLMLTFWQHGLF